MGEDLILESITFPGNVRLKAEYRRYLSTIKNMLFSEYGQRIVDFWADVFGDELTLEEVAEDFEEYKNDMQYIVKDTFDRILNGRRDVVCMEHKGDIIYLSGGMSWGEPPTESCDAFYKFNMLRGIVFVEDKSRE